MTSKDLLIETGFLESVGDAKAFEKLMKPEVLQSMLKEKSAESEKLMLMAQEQAKDYTDLSTTLSLAKERTSSVQALLAPFSLPE